MTPDKQAKIGNIKFKTHIAKKRTCKYSRGPKLSTINIYSSKDPIKNITDPINNKKQHMGLFSLRIFCDKLPLIFM